MKVKVIRNVLEANEKLANTIRKTTDQTKTLVINIMSSPGSGKTSIIEKIIPLLKEKGLKIGVIEGDITTTRDADRIATLDVPISQINTDQFGGDCHLGSEVIKPALDYFDLNELDLVIIENVGNLVCPAEFDTGADYNMVILSLPEGEDKPLKYPLMFRECQLALINKNDLAPYLDIDSRKIKQNILQINPQMDIIYTSVKNGDGLDKVREWIIGKLKG